MTNATEELNFPLSSHMWLMATLSDSADLGGRVSRLWGPDGQSEREALSIASQFLSSLRGQVVTALV